jgi:hypothetical protein
MSGPIYNGTDTNDQPLVDAWWTRGWTAQTGEFNTTPASSDLFIDPDYLIATQPGTYPSFPSNLVAVTVTANYFDTDGNGLPGFLTFRMSDNITVVDSGITYRMPARYAGIQDDGSSFAQNNWGFGRIFINKGLMSVLLFATNNPGITTDSGNALTYTVVEHFMGGRVFSITVPETSPSPTDLNSLITGTVLPYNFDPADPSGMNWDGAFGTPNPPGTIVPF